MFEMGIGFIAGIMTTVAVGVGWLLFRAWQIDKMFAKMRHPLEWIPAVRTK